MTTQMQALFSRILHSATGRQISEELEAERLAKRQELASQIASLKAAHEQALPKLLDTQSKARAKLEAAMKSLEDAKKVYQEAFNAINHANLGNNSAVGRLERELRETADMDTINEFIREMHAQRERAQHASVPTEAEYQARATVMEVTLQALREAREELPLEPLTKDELLARLDKLRSGIPDL